MEECSAKESKVNGSLNGFHRPIFSSSHFFTRFGKSPIPAGLGWLGGPAQSTISDSLGRLFIQVQNANILFHAHRAAWQYPPLIYRGRTVRIIVPRTMPSAPDVPSSSPHTWRRVQHCG